METESLKQQKLERKFENQEIGTVASSDAASRYPTQNDDEVMEIFNVTTSEAPENLRLEDNIRDDMEFRFASY